MWCIHQRFVVESLYFGLKNLTAEEFGVKELVPAYLDPHLTTQDLLTGVSFASGASGYDPLTSKITVNLYIISS